jgi:hypothetical protein
MKWQTLGSQDYRGAEIPDAWEIYDEKGRPVTEDACLDLSTAERIVQAHNSLMG